MEIRFLLRETKNNLSSEFKMSYMKNSSSQMKNQSQRSNNLSKIHFLSTLLILSRFFLSNHLLLRTFLETPSKLKNISSLPTLLLLNICLLSNHLLAFLQILSRVEKFSLKRSRYLL